MLKFFCALIFCVFYSSGCQTAGISETLKNQPRPSVGGVKYRILVDKVYMQGRENGVLLAEDYKRISAMGFNVICPRLNGENVAIVEGSAKLAMANNLYYLVWLRWSMSANGGRPQGSTLPNEMKPGYKPVKYTLASGHEFNLLSPNSDELWTILESDILDAARLSLKYPIIGAFLDFEVYARPLPKPWPGHLYALSYDEKIIGEFAKSKNIKIPHLSPAAREPWLTKHKLNAEFKKFQVTSWKARAKALRVKVDAVNPKFQFAFYPSSYTLFVNDVVWQELGTPAAPVLSGEHYTYAKGFPNKDSVKEYWKISDQQGVNINACFISDCVKKYADRKVPYGVLGGIDPVEEHGKDPRFQARSAVAMSQAGSGYWVFYEGVNKNTQQFYDFEKWFKWANERISKQSSR